MLLSRLNNRLGRACVLALALAALAAPAPAAETAKAKSPVPAKTAVLLVTFGSSHAGALDQVRLIEPEVRAAHPGVEVAWAYTSAKVRQIMAQRGEKLDSPQEALAKLQARGFTRIVVQSLHVIPGAEFHDLVQEAQAFAHHGKGTRVVIGWPLLSDTNDLQALARIMLRAAAPGRQPDQALVWVGHGTHHPAGVAYPALAHALSQVDQRAYLGTVEGYPSFDDVLGQLKASGVKAIKLMPLLTVLGEHSKQDIAGDDADSWKSRLSAAGFTVTTDLTPVAGYSGARDLWLGHLAKAMRELQAEKSGQAKKAHATK
ncbi:MAG: sirohydrochlorin cobaltochelatase [Desulfarculus sp.]|nr:sirohydrochlorin cobaltochelatase [Desulfarculus sp.]